MSDKIELRIGADIKNKKPGIIVEHFLSYQIDVDLYRPANAFHLELANPETVIKPGLICELFVNSTKELTGIIDKVHRKVNKSGVSLAVEGRDFMGLLVDSHCEPPWLDIQNIKLQALATKLLAKVPFINRKDIIYQKNIVGKLKSHKKHTNTVLRDPAQAHAHIEPGQTIYEVLKMYSLSRGLLFYCQPNGVLVFGRPMAKGAPEYTLQLVRTGAGNNVIESEVIDDISRKFSNITVIGQQQGSQATVLKEQINTPPAVQIDRTFPFYKPYYAIDNNDSLSPDEHARMLMEHQRREGMHLIYKVGRHSQNNKNWMINKFCHIKDEVQGLDDDYLIYGRTFELTKEGGPTTKLKLSFPGLVA